MDNRFKNIEILIDNLKEKGLDDLNKTLDSLKGIKPDYKETIKIISFVFLHQNYSQKKINKFIDEIMQSCLRNYADEKEVNEEDYILLATTLENCLNEGNYPFLDKLEFLAYIKERTEYYNSDEGLKDFCKKNKIKLDTFEGFSFEANLENAFIKITNDIVARYSNQFIVRNDYVDKFQQKSADLKAFKTSALEYLNKYDLDFYIPKAEVISYIETMSDEELKRFYSYLEHERVERVEWHENAFDEIDKKYQERYNKNPNDEELRYIENRLANEKYLIDYYKEGLINNPAIMQSILWKDSAIKSNSDIGFGRSFSHRKQISTGLPQTRDEAIAKLKVSLANNGESVDEGYLNEFNYPEIKNNTYDITHSIAFYKNMLLYLKTGECCTYEDPYSFYNPNSHQVNINFRAKDVKDDICNLNQSLRTTQKEFVLSNSMIESFLNVRKVLKEEFTTDSGEFKIYSGRVGEQEYLFVKEKLTLDREIENIFYVLPNGRIDCAQQLFRIDSVNPDKEEGFKLHHRPTGELDGRIIYSVHHIHTYNDIDVIFKNLEPDGNPKRRNIAHYEIDGKISKLLGHENVDDIFEDIAGIENIDITKYQD